MTHEQLILEYEVTSSLVVALEIQKNSIELETLDLFSKETMTKMTSQLMQSNPQYLEVCNELLVAKKNAVVLEKKMGVTKEMIRGGILTSPQQIDSFVGAIS